MAEPSGFRGAGSIPIVLRFITHPTAYSLFAHHSVANYSRMDPVSAFGIAAGAAQFVDLATNVFVGLFKYFQSVKQAPKLSQELQHEAYLVSTVLRDLTSTFESMNNTSIIMGSTNTLNDAVVEFSNTMADMESRIAIKDGELIKRLKWPFTEKENQKYLSRLERYKKTFSLALSTVQMYVLSTTFLIEPNVLL